MSYVCAYLSVQLDKSRVEKECTSVECRKAGIVFGNVCVNVCLCLRKN